MVDKSICNGQETHLSSLRAFFKVVRCVSVSHIIHKRPVKFHSISQRCTTNLLLCPPTASFNFFSMLYVNYHSKLWKLSARSKKSERAFWWGNVLNGRVKREKMQKIVCVQHRSVFHNTLVKFPNTLFLFSHRHVLCTFTISPLLYFFHFFSFIFFT